MKNLEDLIMKEIELVEHLQEAVKFRKDLDWERAMDSYARATACGFRLAQYSLESAARWKAFEMVVNGDA